MKKFHKYLYSVTAKEIDSTLPWLKDAIESLFPYRVETEGADEVARAGGGCDQSSGRRGGV
ncbi:hypothetical protein QJS04_geneDACA001434 [Acorus gramineus]|uniref:Uncharacterized protein n=1 Tax=Acorus gramineus TaxID=55184 RepID=A0AAV9A793_ACOGR|nr:hypothetical protein QJS04_geneDACA001434 [Acorus gramineus]